MVQYYNTGDKDSTNLIAYASDLSMFAMLFTDMQNGTRDYGNDRPIKSVEVAILSTIEQNPGITVSDLSQKQHRTKGTISSIVSNLEKGGYIYREKRPGNAKVVHLYTTPDGERLNTLYIAFVTKKTAEIQSELCEVLTENVNIAYDFFSNIDGIDTAKPEGTYMLFLDCKGWCTAHNQTLEDLYKKGQSVGVYWQDGRPFHNEYGIRVNLALPKSRVEEALNRLRNYVFCD